MFIGVFGRLVKDEAKGGDFNCRIALEMVSRKKLVTKRTKNYNFCSGWKVNEGVKSGLCEELNNNGIDTKELLNDMAYWFGLKTYLSERLEFYCVSYTRGYLNQKKVVLKPTNLISNMRRVDENINVCAVTLDYLIIGVYYQSRDKIEKDVSCNSQ